MEAALFVGRHDELALLIDTLEQGYQGTGRIIFVEGVAGSGKSSLIQELESRIASHPDVRDSLFAYGYCYDETGPHNAYQPFVEVLDSIVRSSKEQRNFFSFLADVLKETAPDWLEAIPVVGDLVEAGAKTVILTSEWFFEENSTDTKFENMARQYAETIVKISRKQRPLVLVVEDSHWIDNASCGLLLRLASYIPTENLVILLTYRPDNLTSEHPLIKVRAELVYRGIGEILTLTGLSEDQVTNYVEQRFGSTLAPNFCEWLTHLCKGQPFFLTQYLNVLEKDGVIYKDNGVFAIDGHVRRLKDAWQIDGRLMGVPIPHDIHALLEYRIQRLLEDEREILQIGAVQGEYFGSLVVAAISEKKELAILARLRQVAEQHRLIALHSYHDWMKDKSEVFAFEHSLMHQAFYRKLTPHERVLYHQEIGFFLKRLADEYLIPPRKLILDIATHFSKGKLYLESGQFFYRAAISSYTDGATVETLHLCHEALRNLRLSAETDYVSNKAIAETIRLALFCSSYMPADRAANLSLLTLANEGTVAAEQALDASLTAQIESLKGHLYIRLGNVPEGLALLRKAVHKAKSSGDHTTEFLTLTQLGMQLAKEDLEESLDIRYEAHAVYAQSVDFSALSPQLRSVVQGQFNKLLSYIGLGEFDRGNYAKAAEYLNQGVDEYRKHGQIDDLLAGLNYLGQLYTATGMFEEAEQALQEAVNLRNSYYDGVGYPWVGYNYGVLGKLYCEWGRLTEAAWAMEEAVHISEATQQSDLITLVRNYYGELLMQSDYSGFDLQQAEQVLVQNLGESQLAGLHRSAAAALTLLAQLYLLKSMPEDAFNYSSQAISYLKKWGDMPALRTEELLYNHYRVLAAIGRKEDAISYVNKAHEVLQKKHAQLQDDIQRQKFCTRVTLSKNIISAYASVNEGDS